MKRLRIVLLSGLIIYMTFFLISLDYANLTWEKNEYAYRKLIMIILLIISVVGSMIVERRKLKVEGDGAEKI